MCYMFPASNINCFPPTHSHNMKYLVYTVNSEEMMKKLIEIKIDGIITDYPDKLSKLL